MKRAAMFDRLISWFDRRYIVAMAVLSPVLLAMNYHADDMVGLLPIYREFGRIISSGFATGTGPGAPTFPMWGYGVLLTLFDGKLPILALQTAMMLAVTFLFIRAVERRALLDPLSLRLLKLISVVSVSWYALFSVLWPYAIAAALLVGWIVSTSVAVERRSFKWAVVAGSLLGLSLNFRSDHLLLPVGGVAVFLIAAGLSRRTVSLAAVWFLSTYLWLIPWALYTNRVVGRPLLTSTNGGVVLFIGLGQLPTNPWGITPSDADPVMHRILREKLGPEYWFTSYEANKIMGEEFVDRLVRRPTAYLKKIVYALGMTVTQGAYRGEFHQAPGCEPNCDEFYVGARSNLIRGDWAGFLRSDVSIPRFFLRLYSDLLSRCLIFLSFALFPFWAFGGLRERNAFLMLVAAAVGYQTAINVFLAAKSASTSMVFLPHVFSVCAGSEVLRRWRRSRKVA